MTTEDAYQGRRTMIDADLEVQKTIEKHWRAMERERIIKLLEGLDTEQWCGTNLQIIDLIKGENK